MAQWDAVESDGLNKYQYGGFEVSTLHYSCWKRIPVEVSYFCYIPERNDMSDVRNWTMASRPCVQ